MRMPKVKKILDEYFKASKIELGQHLNGLFSTDLIVVIDILIVIVDVVVVVLPLLFLIPSSMTFLFSFLLSIFLLQFRYY